MEESLLRYFLKILNKLSYKYPFFASVKNFLRSVKYFFVEKTDIALVIDEIKKSRTENNPVKTIFDVGAAAGDKAILFLKSFPDAIVYCFEPQTESLDKLRKRTAEFKNRIKIFDFGFFDKNSEVILNVTPYRDSSSILPPEDGLEYQATDEIKKENIKVVRMDDFMEQENIRHVDFIKIDVEGVEKEILEGGRKSFTKIDNVFIEILPTRRGIHSSHFSDIFHFFYESGFTFMGCHGDYFFSKDNDVLKRRFKL